MTNIIKELGVPFIRERFSGCLFLDEEGQAQYIDPNSTWPTGRVGTIRLSGTAEAPQAERHSMPEGFFKSLMAFTVPPLGWRMNADGRYLTFMRRNNRSYHRAISPQHNITKTLSPATRYLVDTGNFDEWNNYERTDATALLVAKPTYVPFRQGLEAMREGELFSFAITPNLAVLPDTKQRQAILFNSNRVAFVEPSGEVIFTNSTSQQYIEGQL